MSHKNVLKQLMPLVLDGVFDTDIEIEGARLDAVKARGEDLLKEMFPHMAYELLPEWERTYALKPGQDDSLQLRRSRVIKKMREMGGLSRDYFISLAESLGHTIEIEEPQPFMAGCSYAGDTIYIEEVVFIWIVRLLSQSGYYFRAGESAAGEQLSCPSDSIESILEDLKPAHTAVSFEYEY